MSRAFVHERDQGRMQDACMVHGGQEASSLSCCLEIAHFDFCEC